MAKAPLQAQVLAYVKKHPGSTSEQVRAALKGWSTSIASSLQTLKKKGLVSRKLEEVRSEDVFYCRRGRRLQARWYPTN